MKSSGTAVMLGLVLTMFGGSRLASGQLLVDSDFNASSNSAALRTNSASQDWYESRKDIETLLTLDTAVVGGRSGKKAKLSDSSSGNAYLTQEFSSAQTQRFSVQWDIYVDSIRDRSGTTYDRAAWMFIGDDTQATPGRTGPNAEDSERFVYMAFHRNGGGDSGTMDLVARESSYTTVASGLSLDRWYTIKVICDLTKDTYDVYVDGQLKKTVNARTPKSRVTHISFAQWPWDEGAATYYVDNVTAASSSVDPTGEIVIVDDSYYRGGLMAPEMPIESPGQVAQSWLVTGAPAGAKVTGLSYLITVRPEFYDMGGVDGPFRCSDYEIGLSSAAQGGTGSYSMVWDNSGGETDQGLDDDAENDKSIALSRSTSVFNGQPANQRWYFRVKDTVSGPNYGCLTRLKLVVQYDMQSVSVPSVATEGATNVQCAGATLNGRIVDDGGEACQYRFRYRKENGTYSFTNYVGSKRTGETFSETIAGLEAGSKYYFAAQAKNSAGESAFGSELSFTTGQLQVETRAATAIKCGSATLNGRIVDDGGAACQYKFRYRKDRTTAYSETSWTGSRRTGQTFSQTIAPLSPATKYYFAAKAKNAACESAWGVELTFTTVSLLVETQAATAITCSSATLNGRVAADGGEACQYRFRYRKQGDTSYSETGWTGSRTTGQTFSQGITRLDPGTRYYFAAQIKNSGCESAWGNELSFMTTLRVETRAATDVKCTTATLNGRIADDGGLPCQYKFRYKKAGDTSYAETSWTGAKRTGETFSQAPTGLNPGAKYSFAAKAKNTTCETAWGTELTFTTLKPPTVTPQPATRITPRSATLNGRIVDDGGGVCQYQFRYRTRGGSYTETPWTGSLRGANTAFSAPTLELTPSTMYFFAARAKNDGCEGGWSSELSFTTLTIKKPTVTTLDATSIDTTTTTLVGKIADDGNDVCAYRFRYKKEGGSYKYVSWTGAKRTGQSFSQALTGLDQMTKYYFAAQGRNSAGKGAWGEELTFTTLAAPAITDLSGTYFTATESVYFLDGVSVTEEVTVKINWNGLEPGKVLWQTSNRLYEDVCSAGQTEATHSFDVGTEFGVRGRLKVRAVPKGPGTRESDTVTANFAVIPPPPVIYPDKLRPGGGGGGFGGRPQTKPWTLQYFSEPFETTLIHYVVDTIPDSIPIFGQYDSEIRAVAQTKIFVGGQGTASMTVQDYPKGKNHWKIGGKGWEPMYQLSLNWTYKDGTWKPGGSFKMELFGMVTYPLVGIRLGPIDLSLVDVGAAAIALAELGIEGLGIGGPFDVDFDWSGRLAGDLSIFVNVGAGIEGELGGGVKMLLEFPDDHPLKQFCVKVYGRVYIDYWVGTKTLWDGEKSWCLAGSWGTWSVGSVHALASPPEWAPWEGTGPEIELIPLRDAPFQVMDRDYLGGDYAVWLPEASEDDVHSTDRLTALSAPIEVQNGPEEEVVLQANVFRKSEPAIAADNGELCLAWIYDDPSRSSVNRTQVVFSRSDAGTWASPEPIHDDGTADFSPQLAVLPTGQVFCAWENVNQPLPDDVDLLKGIASTLEIAVASYDPVDGLWTTQSLTGNSYLDRAPRIATADSNTALIVWISNEKNDAMGQDPTALNTIRYRFWDGSDWSEPRTAATGVGCLRNSALVYDGTKAVYVYAVDADWDWVTTNADQDLYALVYDGTSWSQPLRLTNDTVVDANPQVVYEQDEPLLVWYRDDMLVSCRNLDANDLQKIVSAANVGAMDFRLARSPSGNISLVWAGTSAESKDTDIFTASYDRLFDLWSNAYRLISDEDVEKALTVTYVGSDELALAYNKARIRTNEEGFLEIYQTDLCVLRHGFGRDLAVFAEDIEVGKPDPRGGGRVRITAGIHNLGDVPEAAVRVGFYYGDPGEDGVLVGDFQIISGPIPAGGVGTASISWNLPQTDSPKQLYVVVFDDMDAQMGLPERNSANNMARIALMVPDLAVESISVEKTGHKTRRVTARIANNEAVSARNVGVTIHRDSPDGEELKRFTIPIIDANSVQEVSWDWDIASLTFADPEIVLYIVVDESCTVTETDENNNTALTLVHVSKTGDITDDGSIDGADLEMLAEQWLGRNSTVEEKVNSDLDHDGRVDLWDLAILGKDWGWEAQWHTD